MNLTITVEGTEQILNIELPGDFEIDDFLAYLESETQIPPKDQVLLYDNKELPLRSPTVRVLSDWKLEEDTLLVLRKNTYSTSNSNINEPATESSSQMNPDKMLDSPYMSEQIEKTRQQMLSNPSMQMQIDPALRNVLNDKDKFKEEMVKISKQSFKRELEERQKLQQVYNNPDSAESQKKILEIIRQQAIDENMRTAMEETPETFTKVHMLYINCEVNGFPVKAFVDSGAQMTIMTPELAEKCGISRLIDKRFRGEARGVGFAKIEGRVHSASLKIENSYFSCSFTIVPSPNVPMLLGLDMLRRFQAIIDLKQNKLIMGEAETIFLPESECPDISDGNPESAGSFGSNLFSPNSGFKPQSGVKKPAKAAKVSKRVNADPMKVEQLVAMGFDRKQAELALIQTNNNVDLAAGMLFD